MVGTALTRLCPPYDLRCVVIASEAKQSIWPLVGTWIASSLSLLAMTAGFVVEILDIHDEGADRIANIAYQALEEIAMDAEIPLRARRVRIPSREWDEASSAIKRAMRLTAELNKLSFDDAARVREIFSELTGRKVDDTFILIPPFYSAYGLDLRVGQPVSINQCCTLYDMGGVDIGDRVMIGPNVNIITTGHALKPSERRAYIEAKPIVIESNVWIATGATIVGGVRVGENSVVGAGAVVTKDVPPNSFVAGVPARVVRSLEEDAPA